MTTHTERFYVITQDGTSWVVIDGQDPSDPYGYSAVASFAKRDDALAEAGRLNAEAAA